MRNPNMMLAFTIVMFFVYGKLLSTPALFKIGGWATGEEHEAYQFKFQVDQGRGRVSGKCLGGEDGNLYWITDGKDISSILRSCMWGIAIS